MSASVCRVKIWEGVFDAIREIPFPHIEWSSRIVGDFHKIWVTCFGIILYFGENDLLCSGRNQT